VSAKARQIVSASQPGIEMHAWGAGTVRTTAAVEISVEFDPGHGAEAAAALSRLVYLVREKLAEIDLGAEETS
jgi:hypothetical protein